MTFIPSGEIHKSIMSTKNNKIIAQRNGPCHCYEEQVEPDMSQKLHSFGSKFLMEMVGIKAHQCQPVKTKKTTILLHPTSS